MKWLISFFLINIIIMDNGLMSTSIHSFMMLLLIDRSSNTSNHVSKYLLYKHTQEPHILGKYFASQHFRRPFIYDTQNISESTFCHQGTNGANKVHQTEHIPRYKMIFDNRSGYVQITCSAIQYSCASQVKTTKHSPILRMLCCTCVRVIIMMSGSEIHIY